ncbi:hypothetical protein V2J09_002558 [Rumex salicifolius]
MASSESSEIPTRGETYSKQKNPFLSLIPRFPFFNRGGGGGGRVDVVIKKESSANNKSVGEEEDSRTSAKPDVVKFRMRESQAEPLKLESEEPEQNSNPVVLWQVYALGGFILVKWAWAKWQERKANAKKGDSDSTEDQPPKNEPNE